MILVPLRQGRTLYGVIIAFNKSEGREFFSSDVKLVSSLSGTISVSVENSHLYGNLRRLMLGAIKALVSAIDAKDPYTCGHSERVAIISREIARRLGLPVEDVERIYLAGLLHDIGKIGVPERILMKTGELDDEEYDVIKTHPAMGAKILAGVQELEGVMAGVLYHHEWLDGRGYPKGVSDRALPLDGRIIGLADALDAMTSTRVYRPAIAVLEVEREIRRCTGTQFDSGCVDALMEIGLEKLLGSLPVQHGELDLNLKATGPWRS
jgi:putative nucleotidyltransferase with HDIG domain